MDIALLQKICQSYDLGTLLCDPQPLTGGFLHKIFSLFTTEGRYAVKLLNPYIMQRETAMENYRTAEQFESLLEKSGIPIVPALLFDHQKMQSIDGQYFYLYEWYDGKALRSDEIEETHCRRIGELLAWIHNLDRREQPYEQSGIHIDWDFYIEQLSLRNAELAQLLKKNRSLLFESQNNGNLAIKKLPSVLAVCHNDMDSKNVLWLGSDCRLIDLECLGYSNPFVELYELAFCWSGYENCHMDERLFCSFLHAYAEAGGTLLADPETVYWSNYGRLERLEYNVRRALGIECSAEEIPVGVSQVKSTIDHVIYYYHAKNDIIRWLKAV